MTMDYLRGAHLREKLESGSGKEHESLGVVGIIAIRRAVETRPVEVPVGLNGINRNVGADSALENGTVLGPV